MLRQNNKMYHLFQELLKLQGEIETLHNTKSWSIWWAELIGPLYQQQI